MEELLDEYFMILDDAIANKISPNTSSEPEYKYTEENIKELLTSGSYDAFLDFLDFAPQGAIDIVKNLNFCYNKLLKLLRCNIWTLIKSNRNLQTL